MDYNSLVRQMRGNVLSKLDGAEKEKYFAQLDEYHERVYWSYKFELLYSRFEDELPQGKPADTPVTRRLGVIDKGLFNFVGTCWAVLNYSKAPAEQGPCCAHMRAKLELLTKTWARYSRLFDEMVEDRVCILQSLVNEDLWCPEKQLDGLVDFYCHRAPRLADPRVKRIIRRIVQEFLDRAAAEGVGLDTLPAGRRPIEDNEECLICQLPLLGVSEDDLDWCRLQCGYAFHAECIEKWFKSNGGDVGWEIPRCPYCRQLWLYRAVPLHIQHQRLRDLIMEPASGSPDEDNAFSWNDVYGNPANEDNADQNPDGDNEPMSTEVDDAPASPDEGNSNEGEELLMWTEDMENHPVRVEVESHEEEENLDVAADDDRW
ncbi:uncharacterized protein BP01DRAFT_64083 [Aspergillus saccharolyticus JOP 1030-1]|uniref:RING-type domain-containing protein n=1 Tax=Aspergillus saccharolyticus JOP 1030-1 TaxID=1450539 RepID=A0A318ZB47_9EURO|nr:hypothetical protein BP01DRAFT_64083 [Aspergillus saccharolyticus JOP 1030-1]PYH44661.1 hypothetical protein BP01DRAFT_64083 [Aspergillus saccharolyticus JOP 1030-1]